MPTCAADRRRRRLARCTAIAAVAALFAIGIAVYPGRVNWGVVWTGRARLLEGLGLTLVTSAGALVLAVAIGTLGGLARVARSVFVREAAAVYVQLVRGTPFLVQIYVAYFCVAYALRMQRFGGEHNATLVGIVGLGVFGGAYVTEIVRAGVEGVDRGQWEAARSLGLSHAQTLRHVVLPQAFRTMIPPLTGEAVSLIKESSLLSLIGVAELSHQAREMRAQTLEGFASLVPLAILYLCLTLPLTLLAQYLETRLAGPRPLSVAEL